jgi:general secretion pathway protein A
MYTTFFGLKEKPFKLVPDPTFLYLGPSHEDALAHLQYAISQGEGFMVITGEVGTGKTTLCRVFLEELPENTRAAFIFNPKLDAIQLLQSINSEFGLSAEADTLRQLMDDLNAFLLENKSLGHNAVLLIDEAQNLSADVLEQIRLLSNLETTREKLLQIILVGQPELRTLLESHDLRQLSQRISLRYNLSPLTRAQTGAYIEHRLGVAAKKPFMPFSSGAVDVIYRHASGIPRLINIACDRALLKAFNLEKKHISGALAKEAVAELNPQTPPPAANAAVVEVQPGSAPRRFAGATLVALAVLTLVAVVGFGLFPRLQRWGDSKPATVAVTQGEAAKKKIEPKPVEAVVVEPAQPVAVELTALLDRVQGEEARSSAASAVLRTWQTGSNLEIPDEINTIREDRAFFEVLAARHGLKMHQIDRHLGLVSRLNHPAVVRFESGAGGRPVYLSFVGLLDDYALLGSGDDIYRVKLRSLMERWQGSAFVFWKDWMNFSGTIPYDATSAAVISLKMLLNKTGSVDLALTGYFDDQTRLAVLEFQRQMGLPPDGVVGPVTQMALYNKTMSDKLPGMDRPVLPQEVIQ